MRDRERGLVTINDNGKKAADAKKKGNSYACNEFSGTPSGSH